MKTVEFVIPTFDREYPLQCMLLSLMSQTNPNWSAHVVVDTPEETVADEIVGRIYDKRIKISHMDRRYNNWGHTPREYGKNLSIAQYVIMSGDDNYYAPTFVEEIEKAAMSKPGLIYWDMVHSHYKYSYFKCSPAYNQIDMGAFATRNDIAKKIKLNTSFAADGEFVDNYNEMFPREEVFRIGKVLFVHN